MQHVWIRKEALFAPATQATVATESFVKLVSVMIDDVPPIKYVFRQQPKIVSAKKG